MTRLPVSRIPQQRALDAAPLLLGSVVRRDSPDGAVAIRITEVEAYEGDRDPGSHAFRGQTPRTAPMFASGGHLYAYFTYGMHVCLNIVCGEAGVASACLLRAGEVIEGVDLARARRAAARRPEARPVADRDLARGPGSFAKALGVVLEDSGRSIWRAPYSLAIADAPLASARISRGLRVGVAVPGGVAPYDWRFSITGDPTVSRYQPHRTVREASRRGHAPGYDGPRD